MDFEVSFLKPTTANVFICSVFIWMWNLDSRKFHSLCSPWIFIELFTEEHQQQRTNLIYVTQIP
jgi:hypothetical protein